MLKEFAFNTSKGLATLFLRWSNYWGDIAESLLTDIHSTEKEGEHAKPMDGSDI